MPEALAGNQIFLSCHGNQVEVVPGQVAEAGYRVGVEVHHEDAEEHEDARCECVDEELHRRIAPVLPTPYEDEQEHRNQGQLPEDEEDEQVEGDEDSYERAFHQQEQGVEEVAPLGVPLDQHRDRDEDRCEPDHRERQCVCAYLPSHPDRGDEGHGLVLEDVASLGDVGPVYIADLADEQHGGEHGDGKRHAHADVAGNAHEAACRSAGQDLRQDQQDQTSGQR